MSRYRNLILALVSIMLVNQSDISALLVSDVTKQATAEEQKIVSNSSKIGPNVQRLPLTNLLDPSVLIDAKEGLKYKNNSII